MLNINPFSSVSNSRLLTPTQAKLLSKHGLIMTPTDLISSCHLGNQLSISTRVIF